MNSTKTGGFGDEDDGDNDTASGAEERRSKSPLSWRCPSGGGQEEEDCDDDGGEYSSDDENENSIRDLLDSLPKNLHEEKRRREEAASNKGRSGSDATSSGATAATPSPPSSSGLGTLDELAEEEGEEEAESGTNEGHGDEEAVLGDDGLKIAWQYRESVQRQRLGGIGEPTRADRGTQAASSVRKGGGRGNISNKKDDNVFCHSYDLSSKWSDENDARSRSNNREPTAPKAPSERAKVVPIASHCKVCYSGNASGDNKRRRSASRTCCGFSYYRQLVGKLRPLLSSADDPAGRRKLVRLLLYHADASILSTALPLLLTYVRENELPIITLVVIKPWACHSSSSLNCSLATVRRCSDVVLDVEGFAGRSKETYPPPPEFRSLHGLLRVRKMNTSTGGTAHGPGGGHFADATSTKRPAATLFGLKRDRRKLSIQLLHIPPEDYARGGGSVGGGGVRSGAGRSSESAGGSTATAQKTVVGCAGSSGNSSAFDF